MWFPSGRLLMFAVLSSSSNGFIWSAWSVQEENSLIMFSCSNNIMLFRAIIKIMQEVRESSYGVGGRVAIYTIQNISSRMMITGNV